MLKTRLFSHEFRGLNLWNTTERIFFVYFFSKKKTMLMNKLLKFDTCTWMPKTFSIRYQVCLSFNAVRRPRIHFSPLLLNNVPPNNTELGSCLGIPWPFILTSMGLLGTLAWFIFRWKVNGFMILTTVFAKCNYLARNRVVHVKSQQHPPPPRTTDCNLRTIK